MTAMDRYMDDVLNQMIHERSLEIEHLTGGMTGEPRGALWAVDEPDAVGVATEPPSGQPDEPAAAPNARPPRWARRGNVRKQGHIRRDGEVASTCNPIYFTTNADDGPNDMRPRDVNRKQVKARRKQAVTTRRKRGKR